MYDEYDEDIIWSNAQSALASCHINASTLLPKLRSVICKTHPTNIFNLWIGVSLLQRITSLKRAHDTYHQQTSNNRGSIRLA